MKTVLTHNFQYKAHDLCALFEGTYKFSTFRRKLEKQAQLDPQRYEPNKYLGDGFEFFVELFLYLHPNDNRIGLSDYEPVQVNDNGVDGVAKNINGDKSVIQIKYRSDNSYFLTADNDKLANMFSDGMLQHDVVVDKENVKNFRHFIFTSAKGLNFYTDQEMFKSRVLCFSEPMFRSLLDNNKAFWDNCLQVVKSLNNK